ncbi:hypothetical protein KP509_02G027700 [Ceratopteris richardii]|uniref:Fucosyltransferase n=1 Tax=Ceratopteris richardii TaxID=49495 RepID=A0A8T2VBB8_CERRI|nr:hypothetical protein KP509_02G027700 [Ceratopteris richardii]
MMKRRAEEYAGGWNERNVNVQMVGARGIKLKAWSTSLQTGIGGMVALLLLVVVYQMGPLSGQEAEIRDALHLMPKVNAPTFNCSELGLKVEKEVVETQHYHEFRSAATCQSKLQQHCFRKNTRSEHFPPPKFIALLREYEVYHARCTDAAVGNLTDLAMAGEVPDGCKYLVWKEMDGMGNQLLSLACAFLYSLLTNRVMLISRESNMDLYLCNPFPSSSWLLPEDFPEERLRLQACRVFSYLNDTLETVQRKYASNFIPPSDLSSFIAAAPRHIHALITCCDSRRDHQFFCPMSQKLFAGSNWFFYASHEYTLPGFYFIPEFRMKLNDWFPRQDGFMHAVRYLLNPQSDVWMDIVRFYKENFDGINRKIGIQARAWEGNYDPSISRQISRCGVEQNLIPRTMADVSFNPTGATEEEERQEQLIGESHADISVLVSSLREEYRDDLAKEYHSHPNVENLTVNVVSASSEHLQQTGDVLHDRKAIIDIWLLSFMDDLVITPRSTFGSTASGMAGIVPLVFIHYGNDNVNEPACGRTNAVGPCFIIFPREQPCDLDLPRSSIFDPAQKVPEVKFCDFNLGLGVVNL